MKLVDKNKMRTSLVTIDFQELLNQTADLSQKVEAAFGPNGLGICSVSGVPGFVEKREALLPLAQRLANLPEEAKSKLEDPESKLSFGWSHGKEILENGKPDTLKGSFYANPLHDRPTEDPELLKRYPSYCRPNLWPKDDLPELEEAFKDLGKLIVEVGMLLAERCDQYVRRRSSHSGAARLTRVLRESKTTKGRLLHYFPPSEDVRDSDGGATDASSWCGWHTDHGSLTGLTSAMYFRDGREVPCPDPAAGLYIRNRQGALVKAIFPATNIGYQMGEATQIHSGGLLRATPHCVRGISGPSASGVSRATLAVFMQPQWDEPMDLPPRVVPEEVEVGAWTPGLDFGVFTERTISKNYVKL